MDMITSCRNLQTIKLGARFIPKSGFYKFYTPTEDSALSTIISLNENPTNIASDCFPDKVKNTALLLVPKGTVDKYKSADGWREFASIIDEQEDIYGVFKDGILTIYSDGNRNEKDGDVYDVPDNNNRTGWAVIKKDIKTFIIDSSLASVYPINLNMWFRESSATSISGFENLNISGSMNKLFFGCHGLETLNLSKLNTENVMDMSELFAKCDRLKELNLSNFNTSKVTDMENMFYACSQLTKVTIGKSFTIFPEKLFADCKKISSFTTLIDEPFDIPSNCFTDNVKANATLRVPKGTVALYQAKEGWKEFAHITDEEGIAPIDTSGNVDYGNGGGINGDTDLNGNVVGNIYYNISDDNGEYSSTEGCIILKKPTSDTDMNNLEGQDIFGEDFKNGFTGIVFMVQAGSGTVKVNAETVGNMTLNVKFGNNAPITMELEGKMKASFPYSVTEPTYVYIYGGETQTANAKGLRAASSNNALKIYGIEWSDEYETTTNIESVLDNVNTNAIIYNLQGQRMKAVTKGINIINGKKVIVK